MPTKKSLQNVGKVPTKVPTKCRDLPTKCREMPTKCREIPTKHCNNQESPYKSPYISPYKSPYILQNPYKPNENAYKSTYKSPYNECRHFVGNMPDRGPVLCRTRGSDLGPAVRCGCSAGRLDVEDPNDCYDSAMPCRCSSALVARHAPHSVNLTLTPEHTALAWPSWPWGLWEPRPLMRHEFIHTFKHEDGPEILHPLASPSSPRQATFSTALSWWQQSWPVADRET